MNFFDFIHIPSQYIKFLIIPLANKNATTVFQAFLNLKSQYNEHFDEMFKTIKTDNGSEFADLSNLESLSNTLVYYTHPYTSCEKGSVERHNGLIRRFIPKGKTHRSVLNPGYS